jgi:hypothetical protein
MKVTAEDLENMMADMLYNETLRYRFLFFVFLFLIPPFSNIFKKNFRLQDLNF